MASELEAMRKDLVKSLEKLDQMSAMIDQLREHLTENLASIEGELGILS